MLRGGLHWPREVEDVLRIDFRIPKIHFFVFNGEIGHNHSPNCVDIQAVCDIYLLWKTSMDEMKDIQRIRRKRESLVRLIPTGRFFVFDKRPPEGSNDCVKRLCIKLDIHDPYEAHFVRKVSVHACLCRPASKCDMRDLSSAADDMYTSFSLSLFLYIEGTRTKTMGRNC